MKAYVRLQHPFYECKDKGSHDEKEDVKPDDTLGTWWHETLRALATIEGYVFPNCLYCSCQNAADKLMSTVKFEPRYSEDCDGIRPVR